MNHNINKGGSCIRANLPKICYQHINFLVYCACLVHITEGGTGRNSSHQFPPHLNRCGNSLSVRFANLGLVSQDNVTIRIISFLDALTGHLYKTGRCA